MPIKRGILVAFICAVIFFFASNALSGSGRDNKPDKKKEELYKQVSLFSDALAIIQADYVDEVKPRDVIYGALKGMLSSLDPHSQFMDPDAYADLKIDREGKFGGLGIEITVKDGLPTVVTPIEDTPAWKAGLKANDKIVKIGDELTRDMTLNEAVKKLRGKPGDSVHISVLRESEKKVLEFTIVRDVIKIKDIKEARILEDGIGYIRLVQFGENTPKDLDNALERLSKEGMSALVLDLRNNPGGLLDSAVEVAQRFLEKDAMVVYTKGRKASQNMEFRSRFAKPLTGIPMAVLINEGSASGSEIVAGCLQDHRRAIIVGVKSFGKGLVQTVVPLSDGSAVSLTTSRYFTPNGKEIQGKGLEPDIQAPEALMQLAQKDDAAAQEAELLREAAAPQEPSPDKESGMRDYRSDSQLVRAIDVLKGIRLYSSK